MLTFLYLRRALLGLQLIVGGLLLSFPVKAQDRTVALSWTASTSTGVLGYNVLRATSAAGPFTQINGGLITTTTYADTTAVIGSTYTYEVTAVAATCTPATPVTTPCGQSLPSTPASTTVPAQPAVTVTITLAVP